jgi:hypothetical protein
LSAGECLTLACLAPVAYLAVHLGAVSGIPFGFALCFQ